jgi:3-hydroxyisobutyrate dehydrogenase-like beta-hydroxyacid dehydrogenase
MAMRICLLGFGEVGQILGKDLAARALQLTAWDSLFTDPASAPSAALAHHPVVHRATSAHDAARNADVIISAVTADQTLPVAQAVAVGLAPNAYFLDLNSVSPGIKQHAAQVVHEAGGRYVEAAVMSAFPPQRLASPINLGGPHAHGFLPIARVMGLSAASVFSDALGPASAAKMCRSIIIKGLEALLLESMLTARHHAVEQSVLDSLADLLPATDWRALSQYMMSRALLHGRRRAEEMHEACRTVAAAGLAPLLGTAIAQRQAWAGEQGMAGQQGSAGKQASLEATLDALLQRMIQQQVAS